MRFNYSRSSSFFFLPFGKNPHQKIFFSPLFGLSRPTKNLRFYLCVPSKASFSILPSAYIQIFCFFAFFQTNCFREKMKSQKLKSEIERYAPKVAIHTHEYSSTLLHKQQCLLLLNKSRPSPASRPPRFKYVSLSFVFLFRDPIRSRARARLRLPGITFFAYPTLYTIRENKMQNDTLSLSLSDAKPSSLLRSR
jgi:hypothetical protein